MVSKNPRVREWLSWEVLAEGVVSRWQPELGRKELGANVGRQIPLSLHGALGLSTWSFCMG